MVVDFSSPLSNSLQYQKGLSCEGTGAIQIADWGSFTDDHIGAITDAA
jgi:hypothetical protein